MDFSKEWSSVKHLHRVQDCSQVNRAHYFQDFCDRVKVDGSVQIKGSIETLVRRAGLIVYVANTVASKLFQHQLAGILLIVTSPPILLGLDYDVAEPDLVASIVVN